MKITIALFSSIHVFAHLASAHPFFIFNPHATAPAILPPTPTSHHVARQNLLDDLQSAANSLLGISTSSSSSSRKTSSSSSARTSSSSSASVRTIAPPVTATPSTSSTSSTRQRTSSSTSTDDSSTSSDDSSSTSTSTDSSTSTSVTSTSTSSISTTSATAATVPTGNIGQPAPTASQSNDNNGAVPPGGIAVAVIMSLLALLVTAWLIFRYHPKCRAWWMAREAKKFEQRSYRDAIDGPGYDLRSQAMGSAAPSRRQTMLKSFFAPATVKLGNGQEIRRKPVNWGADTASTRAPSYRSESATPPLPPIDMEKIPVDSEKIPMTAAAAPMGQIERYSYIPKARPQQSGPPLPSKTPELPSKALELPARPRSHGGLEVVPTVPMKTPELPAKTAELDAKTPELPAKTRSSAVSPMSMHPRDDMERLPPISPISHRGVTSRELPELPPIPAIPGLNIAKRGSDGVFRLA